jgi:lipoprotein-anchoring transpeptidase ErfK/SrfK
MARYGTLFVVAILLCGCAAPGAPGTTPQPGYPLAARAASPTPHPAPLPTASSAAPTVVVPPPPVASDQKWIEVDLARQVVRLRVGQEVVAAYPAATGVMTSTETATQPGVYMVQQMIEGPIENVPGVFVSDILIYDWGQGAGIHSLPMDRDGRVLDPTLGTPASAGCVRVGESAAVFRFAQMGMKIWIH